MKIPLLFIFISCICFSQQNKIIDFSDIKSEDGIAYFENGEKVDGEVHKRRTFGPYYESIGKTFIFDKGILISEILYFNDIPENIISKKIDYYPNTTQVSRMTIYHDKKHKNMKIYEFYENGKRKSMKTIENGIIKFQKLY